MSAPHLILLHGALGDVNQLAPLEARLAVTRRVTRLEFEGHGSSALVGRPLRTESLASSVVAHMDEAGIERADLFGYSMGGYVALFVAAAASDRVSRVATLATKLVWTPEVATRECAMLDAPTIRAKVPKFAAALEARHTGAGWEPLLSATAEMLRDLGDRPRVTDELLASIEQPVRLGVGDRDLTVSIDETAAASRCLKNGELEVHPRTPHPFEKAPVDRIAASLVEFFGA